MQQLDPKAVWLFFFNTIATVLFAIPAVFILVLFIGSGASLGELLQNSNISEILLTLLKFWGVVVLLFAVFAYLWARLSYHFYRYELTENSFRKESGIIWKKYVSIPYDRIQNVDIHRGILARILGLSDLQIQTAGVSATVSRFGMRGAGAEGKLPGVSRLEAERLRDELVKRAQGQKVQVM